MPRNLLTGGAFRSTLFAELLGPEPPTPSLPPGSMIGVWRIDRLLGRGGMSEVYLAERSAGDFAQTVAIKIIAADIDAAELLREERRILGRLRHPAIATLIDGGELESGCVWLAMEYVDGEPIDIHAETRRLGWEARVALVERLCEAVDHAHRHLLVHRDIKPSNVLVDGSGHAKLIDFGIAVVEHRQETGPRWLTPGYAAPEQLRGEPITTATDLFQLGQLLRTLTAADVLPTPLPRPLAADLARVIDRATATEPTQRHASAAALAADLTALRQRRPLASQRSGLLQRLRLWRLRHAWVPWAAAPLALLLIASLVQTTRSVLREADERAMALREEQVSSAIGAFFIDLFNEPVAAGDSSAGVTALLDRGQRRLLARPNPVPQVQAGLLQQLALANVQMERRDMAVELLEEAIRVQRSAGLQGPLASSLATLARLRTLAGDAQRGAALAAEATAALAGDSQPSRDRFLALTQLGEYHANSFAFAEAERVLREALALGAQRYGEQSPELYRTKRLLIELLRNQWRVDEAVPLAASLVTQCQRDFGADDARCVLEFIHWQRARAQAGEITEARRALEALWAQRGSWEGALRRYRGHALLFALAEIHTLAGDHAAAEQVLHDSLCELVFAEGRGGQHWTIDRGTLALLLRDLGDVEQALRVSSEARAQYAEAPEATLESAFWISRQALIEHSAGRIDPATEPALRRAVERLRAVYGEHAYFVARAELTLALLAAQGGRADEARRLLDRVARAAPQGLRYYHALLQAEADTLRASLESEPPRQREALRSAYQRLNAVAGRDHPQTAAAALRLAAAEQAAGLAVDPAAVLADYRRLAANQVSTSPALQQAGALLAALRPPGEPAARALLPRPSERACPAD